MTASSWRLRLAAVGSTAAILIGFFGAPLVPVLIGAVAVSAWNAWR